MPRILPALCVLVLTLLPLQAADPPQQPQFVQIADLMELLADPVIRELCRDQQNARLNFEMGDVRLTIVANYKIILTKGAETIVLVTDTGRYCTQDDSWVSCNVAEEFLKSVARNDFRASIARVRDASLITEHK